VILVISYAVGICGKGEVTGACPITNLKKITKTDLMPGLKI
jgi:hypothetical protein